MTKAENGTCIGEWKPSVLYGDGKHRDSNEWFLKEKSL